MIMQIHKNVDPQLSLPKAFSWVYQNETILEKVPEHLGTQWLLVVTNWNVFEYLMLGQ
jgi:hypothetical protein